MHSPVQRKYATKVAHGARGEQGKKSSLLDCIGDVICKNGGIKNDNEKHEELCKKSVFRRSNAKEKRTLADCSPLSVCRNDQWDQKGAMDPWSADRQQ